jgi:hypothetical protein
MNPLDPLNNAILGARYCADQISEHALVAYYLERHNAPTRNHHIKVLLEQADKLAEAVEKIRALTEPEKSEEAA